MPVSSAPACRHRGKRIGAQRWICRSPKIVASLGLVTADQCAGECPFVDHPSTNEQSAPLGETTRAITPEMLAIAMITAPRPVETASDTIAELRFGGFDQTIHVFAEPGSPDLAVGNVVVTPNEHRLGNWRNWWRAAVSMLDHTDAPFILICEDDLQLARNAATGLYHAMATLPLHDWGYASLYLSTRNAPQNGESKNGWIDLDLGGRAWGSLAWCFTRESLAETLQSHIVASHRSDRETDTVISRAVQSVGRKTYFHQPSLCEHAGTGVSSLGHRPHAHFAAHRFERNGSLYHGKASLPGKLAVVTSHFNPMGYENRRTNYREFAREMAEAGVDMFTVEVAFENEPFDLPPDERTLQLRTSDIMWHKEAALNRLIEELPDEYDKVAWIDADLIFSNSNWPRDAAGALEETPVVQLFSSVVCLQANGDPVQNDRASVGAVFAESGEKFAQTNAAPGYAWAARRSFLRKHRLYDAGILGSGDAMMVAAFTGRFNYFQQPTDAAREHFEQWARPVLRDTGGGFGVTPGRIYHRYHGSIANRRYYQRRECLSQAKFDPARDLQRSESGLWSWGSDKTGLHAQVVKYFSRRKEDGVTPSDVAAAVGSTRYMTLEQGQIIDELIRTHALKNCLEIGTFHGVGACYLAAASAGVGGRVTTVDLPGSKKLEPNAEQLLASLGLSERVTIIRERAGADWVMLKWLEQSPRPEFDFIYIDAAHTWRTTGLFFFLADKLLQPGGWMLLDDILFTPAGFEQRHGKAYTPALTAEQINVAHVGKVWELLVKEHPEYSNFRTIGNWGLTQKKVM